MKAVVFVDIQKDFIDGALHNDKAIEITSKIVKFAKECIKDNYKLYATRDTHEKTTYGVGKYLNADMTSEPQCGYLATLEGQKLPVEHCIEGTDGWMIDEHLMDVIIGKTAIVNKNAFGSFDLAEVMNEDLERWNDEDYYDKISAWDDKNYFDEIIICGFATDICVVSNALILRAKFPNTKIIVMKDLCAGTSVEKHEAALKVMESCMIDVK